MSSDGSEMVSTAGSVAEKWRWTRAMWESIATDHGDLRVMTDILDAVYAVPVLRQFFDGTSHFTLLFRTVICTYDYHSHGWDLPSVEPRQGDGYIDRRPGLGYVVRNRPRGGVIGEADDAEGAAALLLAHLPANVGAAVACDRARHSRRPGNRPTSSG